MDTLIRVTKLYSAKKFVPIDFGPWLQSINDLVGTITVGDAPDVVETYTITGALVELVISGGAQGITYRIPVTCTSASKQVPRTIIVEVAIPGVADSSNSGGGGSGVIGDLDGGTPSSNYGGVTAIDGGSP